MGEFLGVMGDLLDYSPEISLVEHQSRYYVHLLTNNLGKVMNPIIPLAVGEIAPLLFFYKDGFGIK